MNRRIAAASGAFNAFLKSSLLWCCDFTKNNHVPVRFRGGGGGEIPYKGMVNRQDKP